MRKILIACLVTVTLLYAASPFWAAWSLREAVRRGDVPAIEQRVEWAAVRASLKASLSAQTSLVAQVEAVGAEIRPTLWQRVKAAFGATMLDRFVETYVTPEGLPQLYNYRTLLVQSGAARMTGYDTGEEADRWQRFVAFYHRIKRAEFQSPTRVELEVADRFDPERRYIGVMQLSGLTWKLTSLRIVIEGSPAQPAPTS